MTRNAATVLDGDLANLEQAGLRGLGCGSSTPSTRICRPPDRSRRPHRCRVGRRQLRGGSDEDETAWRNGSWHVARLRPARCGRTNGSRPSSIRRSRECDSRFAPGDVESLEFVAQERALRLDRVTSKWPSRRRASTADVLVAFGRYPDVRGLPPAARYRLRRCGDRSRPGGHRSPGRRPGGRDVRQRVLVDVCDQRCAVAVTLPDEVPLDDAVAIPTASATAWYSLHDLARISAEDRF